MQLPVRCSEKGNTTKLMKDEQEANFRKGICIALLLARFWLYSCSASTATRLRLSPELLPVTTWTPCNVHFARSACRSKKK